MAFQAKNHGPQITPRRKNRKKKSSFINLGITKRGQKRLTSGLVLNSNIVQDMEMGGDGGTHFRTRPSSPQKTRQKRRLYFLTITRAFEDRFVSAVPTGTMPVASHYLSPPCPFRLPPLAAPHLPSSRGSILVPIVCWWGVARANRATWRRFDGARECSLGCDWTTTTDPNQIDSADRLGRSRTRMSLLQPGWRGELTRATVTMRWPNLRRSTGTTAAVVETAEGRTRTRRVRGSHKIWHSATDHRCPMAVVLYLVLMVSRRHDAHFQQSL